MKYVQQENMKGPVFVILSMTMNYIILKGPLDPFSYTVIGPN